MRTVSVGYLAAAVAAARARGVDARPMLLDAGIAPHLLTDPRARFTSEQVAAFTRDLWRRADDELFGLGVAPVPRGTFRLVGHALIHSPDLGAALERFVGFGTALPGLPSFSVTREDGTVRLGMDLRGGADPGHLVTDFLLVFAHRFAGWLVGRRLVLVAVELAYPAPPDVIEYDRMFGVAPRFGAPSTGLVFDERAWGLPVVRDEADLEAYLHDAPADVLSRRDYGTTLADQVRTILERGPGGRMGADEIAERLALSPSHLRRRLSAQGTSLTQIREELQRDAAITALSRGEAVDAVSSRLGFSEPRAFRRAFRRWTGRAPSDYRPGGPKTPVIP